MPNLRTALVQVKTSALPALLICLLAFALRSFKLGDANLWFDEAFSVGMARKDLADLTLSTAHDVHPPLYYWLLYIWKGAAGETEFALRYLSLAAGTLTVAGLYALSKRTLGVAVALLAALFLAISRFHIGWSQEIRMYALAGLWVVFSYVAFLGLLGKPTLKNVLGFLLSTAAALYTLYLSGLVLLIQNLVFVAEWIRSPRGSKAGRLVRWAGTQAALLILYAPWLITSWGVLRGGSDAEPFSLLHLFRLYGSLLSVGISTQVERYDWINIALGVIFLAGMLGAWRTLRHSTAVPVALLLWLTLLLPPFWIFFVSQIQSILYAPRLESRHFIPFLAPIYLLLAASLSWSARHWRLLAVGAAASLLGLSTWTALDHYSQRYLRDELQSMVLAIRAYAQPGDGVVLVSGDRYPLFLYYYDRLAWGVPPPVYPRPGLASEFSSETIYRELAPLLQRHPRIWLALVERVIQDPQGLAQPWLESRWSRLYGQSFGHNALLLYAPTPQRLIFPIENLDPQHPLRTDLTPGVRTLGFDLPVREFRPGDTIHLAVYLEAAAPEGEMVATLVEQMGSTRIGRRVPLALGPTIQRLSLDLPVSAAMSDGTYHLGVSWMDSVSASPPTRLTMLTISGASAALPRSTPDHPLIAQLGEDLQLLGYTRIPEGKLRPGQTLELILFWGARRTPPERYTVFTHILGPFNPATGGPLWGQHDGEPVEGSYPTDQWIAAETLVDRHFIVIDPAAAPGEYLIEVGMYRPETGERLPAWIDRERQENDRIILERITIEA